ncbi:MAG: amidohydrolase family protein, partial [Candidatus Poribacteria bacterium]|nr:amidohydrolase family protein [Candidatus Poribacteria bacterium]
MTDRLVKNGRVLNPYTGTDAVLDVRLRDRTISEIGANLSPQHGEDVLDATGCLVVPGLIDMHVHFRDPGLTYKESIQTGSEAAAAGGFVAVVCMANTKPSLDTARQIRYVYEKADEAGLIAVYPVGSISKSLLGQEPTHYEELRFAGAIAFSDDGVSCMDEEIMRLVLRQSVEPGGVPVVVHCEDPKIAHSGVMNDGDVSKELGLAGIPREAEESIIARDIRLAEETGGRLHIQHVTTRGGVALIREGKARGVNVNGEACP